MRTILDARTSSGYGSRSRHGIHGVLDIETALAAADTASRLRDRVAAGEKTSGPAASRALSAAAQTPRFEGRTVTRTFARKATAFLARDGVVLYDNPDAFLICAFKRDNALCEPDPGATAPRQYDCRPGCGNTVRTDTHARRLRQRATELDTLATRAPGPSATEADQPGRPERGPTLASPAPSALLARALRAVRAWLTPSITLRRWRRAWSGTPPPAELQALLDTVSRGQHLNPYSPI